MTIWVIQYDSELYVTGYNKSGWVRKLGKGGPVKMRLGDNTYPLIATAVKNNAQAVLTAYMDKYRPDYPDIVAGFPTSEEASDSFTLFKLMRQ